MPEDAPDFLDNLPTDPKAQIEFYRQVVLDYERVNAEIDALIMQNHGGTEDMSPADLSTYRNLASQRDDLYNQMKALEELLLSDDS